MPLIDTSATCIKEWQHPEYTIRAEHSGHTVYFTLYQATEKLKIESSQLEIDIPGINLVVLTLTQASAILSQASIRFDPEKAKLYLNLFGESQVNRLSSLLLPGAETSIPYEIDTASIPVGSETRQLAIDAVKTWNACAHYSGIRFVPRVDQPCVVLFVYKPFFISSSSPTTIRYVYCAGEDSSMMLYQLNQLVGMRPSSPEEEIFPLSPRRQTIDTSLQSGSVIPVDLDKPITDTERELLRQPEWKTLQYKGAHYFANKEYADALNYYSTLYVEYRTVFSVSRQIALMNICTICCALIENFQRAKVWNNSALKHDAAHSDTLRVRQALKYQKSRGKKNKSI